MSERYGPLGFDVLLLWNPWCIWSGMDLWNYGSDQFVNMEFVSAAFYSRHVPKWTICFYLLRIYMMRWLAGLIMVVVILSLGVSRQASRAQPLIRAETQSKLLISHSRATNNSCLGWLHSLWTLKSLSLSLYRHTHTKWVPLPFHM